MNYDTYEGYTDASAAKIRKELRGINGIQYTEGLFVETATDKSACLYSLKEYPTLEDYPSAYQIFIHSVDETEAAKKLVGSLSHWKKLLKLKWFQSGRTELGFDGILSWRQDMYDRDRSAAKKVLRKLASEGNVTAARSLEKMASEELNTLKKEMPKPRSLAAVNKEEDGLGFVDNYGS